MKRHILRGLTALAALIALLPGSIVAQQMTLKNGLPGAWSLVAVVGERADGSTFEPFGGTPKGMIIFTGDGHFSLFQSTGKVPRIASNDRAKATPAEATAIVGESIAYFGTYSANEPEKTLSVSLTGSTFANLVGGPEQKRIVTSLTPDELRFTNPRTPAGVTLMTVWKRAKAP